MHPTLQILPYSTNRDLPYATPTNYPHMCNENQSIEYNCIEKASLRREECIAIPRTCNTGRLLKKKRTSFSIIDGRRIVDVIR